MSFNMYRTIGYHLITRLMSHEKHELNVAYLGNYESNLVRIFYIIVGTYDTYQMDGLLL